MNDETANLLEKFLKFHIIFLVNGAIFFYGLASQSIPEAALVCNTMAVVYLTYALSIVVLFKLFLKITTQLIIKFDATNFISHCHRLQAWSLPILIPATLYYCSLRFL